MYTHLITFFSVILLFELYSPSPEGMKMGWGQLLAATGATVILLYLLGRRAFSKGEQRIHRNALGKDIVPLLRASLLQRFVILAVGAYALILYFFQWKTGCEILLGKEAPQSLLRLLGIAPFMALLIAVWTASYPSKKDHIRPERTLIEYLVAQMKLNLPILAPWFGILLFLDVFALISPDLARRIQEDPLWALGTFVLFLLVLAWLFPWLVVRLWHCPPLPEGPHRKRLEAFFTRHKFRYSGMVLWTLFEGSISTAGILGIFPRSRYILITPSLLHMLSDEEMEAVMSHEMGHARHHHMFFYLVFMVGLTLVFNLALEGIAWTFTLGSLALEGWGVSLEAWLGHPENASTVISLAMTIPALILVFLYFRFGFGFFSRNFERQSDIHALEIQGVSGPIIQSFEKISGFNPIVRMLPSWHHFSVQQRIDFLRDCEAHPRLIRKHHRKVRLLVIGYLIFFLALFGLLIGWRTQHWGQGWALAIIQHNLQRRVMNSPEDVPLLLALGNIAFERKDFVTAEKGFLEVIRLDPQNPESLNNLAWLYATAEEGDFRKPKEALRLAQKAAKLKPTAPYILDTLAEAYFINGRFEEALEMEEEALRVATERRDYYRSQLERFRRALRLSQ